jgi:predicted XRE-type DNA-binding protein
MASRNHLERGGRKYSLIRALAKGELTQSALAAIYGVAQPSISEFAQRHKEEIVYTREKIDDKFIGLWVADKQARVAEYQRDIEQLQAIIDRLEAPVEAGEAPADSALVRAQVGGLIRAKQAGLRMVADELGSIPAKIVIGADGGKVKYTIEATDSELGELD